MEISSSSEAAADDPQARERQGFNPEFQAPANYDRHFTAGTEDRKTKYHISESKLEYPTEIPSMFGTHNDIPHCDSTRPKERRQASQMLLQRLTKSKKPKIPDLLTPYVPAT